MEHKAAKRKGKQEVVVREKNAGLAERLKAAARHPVLHCRVTSSIWDEGIGQVFLSRELPNGSVAYASFLVDRYCLGVKDAFADISGRFTYDSRFQTKNQHMYQSLVPEAARKLVEGAVEFARGLGLSPHPDYQKARFLFGDIDAQACSETFEYGKDGKPYFMSGPNDTPARCREILHNLHFHCGPDGFLFTIKSQFPEDVLPPVMREQQNLLLEAMPGEADPEITSSEPRP